MCTIKFLTIYSNYFYDKFLIYPAPDKSNSGINDIIYETIFTN